MTANRRKIVRALTVLDMTCTSGDTGLITDGYRQLPVSQEGPLQLLLRPDNRAQRRRDHVRLPGAHLRASSTPAKTKITGTWSYTITEHDAAGAVTDTCTSGSVSWTAKQ